MRMTLEDFLWAKVSISKKIDFLVKSQAEHTQESTNHFKKPVQMNLSINFPCLPTGHSSDEQHLRVLWRKFPFDSTKRIWCPTNWMHIFYKQFHWQYIGVPGLSSKGKLYFRLGGKNYSACSWDKYFVMLSSPQKLVLFVKALELLCLQIRLWNRYADTKYFHWTQVVIQHICLYNRTHTRLFFNTKCAKFIPALLLVTVRCTTTAAEPTLPLRTQPVP